jgi:cysteine desulfurase
MAQPLTKLTRTGQLYTRPPSVEAKIDQALTEDEPRLWTRLQVTDRRAPDYLTSECLVHLFRSGTLNIPAIVGGGVAAQEAHEHLSSGTRIAALRDQFEETLCQDFPNVVVFGREESRIPNTSCFAIPEQNATMLADRLALSGVFVGIGSACSSGALHPPKTLLAMSVPHELAAAALRVSFSRYSREEDGNRLVAALRVACG